MGQFRHDHRRERYETAERQLSAHVFSDFGCNGVHVLCLLDEPLGLDQQNPAGGGQREPLRVPSHEELGPKLLLQMGDGR